VNGTTGESATLSDDEIAALYRAVVEAVGDRATVLAGAGNNDTRHTLELAQLAEKSGAHGLLIVTPYYNKPPQTGIEAHFRAVADATELPVMVYDVPHRTAMAIDTETLVRLADHPRILAVKDAKGDLGASSWVMARTGLAYYCGDDMVNLPSLSIGAVGFVSVVGHLVGVRLRQMLDAYEAGDIGAARDIHLSLLPVYTGIFRTQGAILTKAALKLLGLPAGPMRLPLVDATAGEIAVLRRDLAAGGIEIQGEATA
jgi:4-hydroxy-tetrahydrodipicolinate synthase